MLSLPARLSLSIYLAWLLLVLTALGGLFWWWQAGRAVEVPDAPSARIACVSYAPYRRSGESPFNSHRFIRPAQISADLRILSEHFNCVRTYAQSQGLSVVPAIARRYGMKVLMGIWLDRNRRKNAREIAQGIANVRAYPQVLRGVIVGNEVLLRGELSPRDLAAYIRQVRVAIPASVPVSYADVWENWKRYPQMAAAVDYLTIHVLPYWEDKPIAVKHALRHVVRIYAAMRRAFPGKRVMIGETGWPSAGRSRRAAVPGLVNEARYLRTFLAYAQAKKIPYNLIEAFDQPWKRVQEGTVGGYWGILNAQAKPKFSMRGPVTEVPYGWLLGGLAALIGALLFALVGSWKSAWRGWRGYLALVLAGLGSGSALLWQGRQMYLACTRFWQWSLAVVACLLALYTALSLARSVAACLARAPTVVLPTRHWRFAWLFALAFYSLLEVFDGRYRDFPLGLFALPSVAYAAWALLWHEASMPSLEQRLLAALVSLLGGIMVVKEHGQNLCAWLWLGLCLAMAVPVFASWWRVWRRLSC